MRNRKLAISLALGALAAGCWAGYRRSQARSSRPVAQPEYLQTWEGEGGGVPVDSHHTASQVAPRDGARLEDDNRDPTAHTAPQVAEADGSPSSVKRSALAGEASAVDGVGTTLPSRDAVL